jgi:hypothetical protein
LLVLAAALEPPSYLSQQDLVRNTVDALPGERALISLVAAAIEAELEDELAEIFVAAAVPPLDELSEADLVEAAHRALDANDEALAVIAESIERQHLNPVDERNPPVHEHHRTIDPPRSRRPPRRRADQER